MGNSDSKSKFRESVYKLSNEQVPASQLEFWTKLWKIPTTWEEIFTLIQPEDVRLLRQQQQANLKTMIHQAVDQLGQITQTPTPKYYAQAHTCIRVLTRLIPFTLEAQDDKFVQEIFWDTDDGTEPLAQRLLTAIMKLCFMPEFTVTKAAYEDYQRQIQDQEQSTDEEKPYAPLLWQAGVAFPDAICQTTTAIDRNRKEVLKLFLTCFSGTLYRTSDDYDQSGDPFLRFATSRECPFGPTLFYSLLNVVVTYDPVGWGLPYSSSLVVDEKESLVDISVQVLLLLLDFGQLQSPTPLQQETPTNKDQDEKATGNQDNDENREVVHNCYRELVRTMRRPEDFELVYSGISKLLNNYHQAMNTYLPNSMKQIKCHQEMLVLLWKMLDENKEFLKFVMRKDTCSLVTPILFLLYEGRQDPSKVGLIHICTFILLLLSGERSFSVGLNKPYTSRLPLDLPPFKGNHFDLLIIVLHKVIVNGYEKLNSVYNCFLTIISNISPYAKSLAMASSVRLVRLFKLFSQPRFLYDKEANHHLLFFMLDTFNNLIQYQYEGNTHLIYAMVQNQELFHKLKALPMPTIHTPKQASEPLEQVDSARSLRSMNSIGSDSPSVQDEPDAKATGTQTPKLRHEEAMMPALEESSGRFIPTPKWVLSWKKKLPLNTTLRLLQFLVPQLEDKCEEAGGGLDEYGIIEFLKSTTMVGLLPVPHPIVIRKYQPNQFTNLWFTTFTWGVIFLRNQEFPLFDGATVKLFTINVL